MNTETIDKAIETLGMLATACPETVAYKATQETRRLRELKGDIMCRNREGVVIPIGQAFATVLRFDWERDDEGSWSWHATLAVQGELPGDADGWDVTAIQSALAAVLPFQGAGNGVAGRPFANEPWLQFLGHPCRTIIVSQSGGLDV